jgi:D-xylonolactonase
LAGAFLCAAAMPEREQQSPESVWSLGAELGEGPVWAFGALWFVDIKRRLVHRFEPSTAARRSWPAPSQIGFLFPAEGGGFVAGLDDGLHHFDPESGEFAPLARVEADRPDNRLNDGVVDPSGRLWFGTMDDSERKRSGAFYRFERGTVHPTGLDGIAITNGPALSPDGRILYHVDTLARTIRASEIGADGALGPARPFAAIDPANGHPDGPTIDAEGCLWVALYGGWEARRYSPAGELVGRVAFPCANITKIAFGGEDLRTLYATSARHLLKPDEAESQKQAGDLFALRVEIPGIACPLVRLD